MKVEIYTKETCPWCVKAKQFVTKDLKSTFVEYVLGKDATKQDIEARAGCEVRTVPQIFIDGEYVGGYDKLVQKYGKGSNQ